VVEQVDNLVNTTYLFLLFAGDQADLTMQGILDAGDDLRRNFFNLGDPVDDISPDIFR